ncbi:hypothetical protein RM572_04975 [Streptomyces sp. DSM 42041]|uniref:Lipoprotein n=1 Tax=Streptomyces hazeniae TaxID=3075538 RepID=A0ABU2NPI1_9ACTN|nr:hypothetical protein [Streptomyces sp. DSM 42041]MDT0378128.1 hypothetical protein [Streptomyces sp. DSM 42041]
MPNPAPRRRSLVAGLFAVIASTACAPGGHGGHGPGRPGGGTEGSATSRPGGAPSPSTSATAPGMPGPPLLEWLVTGGFAGVRIRTLLHEDGTYTVSTGSLGSPDSPDSPHDDAPGRSGRLPARDVARIRALLAEARLAEGPRRTLDPRLRDGFHYRVAHGGHVVHRDDTTLGAPLRKVRALLPPPSA